jgi:hypothetical protein
VNDPKRLVAIALVGSVILFFGCGFLWLRARHRAAPTVELFGMLTLFWLVSLTEMTAILVWPVTPLRPLTPTRVWIRTVIGLLFLVGFAFLLWRESRRHRVSGSTKR